ncbi:MAG: tetratricopeptide repeat protein [Bacteroidales bacterium]
MLQQEADYRKTVDLCEKGRYTEAKPILQKLIQHNPGNSEFHRIMGQILSDEGKQDDAIDCLIDALRWNPNNGWALIMMGNIFAKFKNDVPTAMKYYDQAVIANPNESIAINNIGGNLLQQGKIEEAKKYFNKALSINNNYPNTHFALGMIAEMEADLKSAFYSTAQAIKLSNTKDALYQNAVKQIFEISKKIISTDNVEKILNEYKHKLEFEGDRKIEIIQDDEITTAAKFEFAENYKRDIHIVKYKPSYPAVEHLIMHELVHLDFVIKARKENLNMLFISNQSNKRQFISKLDTTIKNLKKKGLSEEVIENQCNNLFEGVNLQIFNAPIDLFIEDYIYREYADIRPFQLISLYTLIKEGINAVTDKRIIELFQADIISKSKIYNMVNALQFKDLYGIDLNNEYKATQAELKTAKEFYNEYLQYKDDKEAAEEYELVQHWAEDLKLDTNFELIDENTYRNKRTDVNSILESIEKDPFDIDTKDPFKEREMEKFQKAQAEIGINMAIVMFMVDALQFFEGKPTEEIKEVAFEIAMQGTQGYSPEKNNYYINSIPNKTFSGYHILAYYYISWALAIPEMLAKLQLPYDEEYKLAMTMFKSK